MEKLVNVLQVIIDKYNVTPEDFALIQDAISELENGVNTEFVYVEDAAKEAPIEVDNSNVEA